MDSAYECFIRTDLAGLLPAIILRFVVDLYIFILILGCPKKLVNG